MKATTICLACSLGLMMMASCESSCPECPGCELDHVQALSEWGEKVKAELMCLFLDIDDLLLAQVHNTSGDSLHWSGYDGGEPGKDSRRIQVDFLETELILVFSYFREGKWQHSYIRLQYEIVTSVIVQDVTVHDLEGKVVRRASNVLIFVLDGEEAPIHSGVVADRAESVINDVLSKTPFHVNRTLQVIPE